MLFGFNDDDFDDDVYYEPDDSKGGGYDPDHDDGYNGRFSGRERGRSAMQSASMILAVLCIISSMFIYISLPLGAVAIVLALLSRGERKTLGKAKTAVTVAAAGMLASSAITGYAFWRVTTDPVLRRQMQQMVEYYSGAYLGQSASEAFPWLFEKDEETESETGVAWSDDLLNDHDRLIEYFLTPQEGDARGDSQDASGPSGVRRKKDPGSGTAGTGTENPDAETEHPDSGSAPVIEPPAGLFTGGDYT